MNGGTRMRSFHSRVRAAAEGSRPAGPPRGDFMSRPFSLAKFCRMSSNELLHSFFAQLGLGDLEVDWESLGKRDPRPLVDAVERLPRIRGIEIEGHARDLHDLADATGRQAIVEAGLAQGIPEIVDALPD